ncbi:MAG: flavin reductase family protein [Gammaproteobacteria bacterium]|nr:flavin reductase family protein [Gammaproteobacteria bacterium]MBU1441055.1 flavin reductase family protein [Gammaproteobacteria bacterium]MBU2408111.1 flavin reductase family protein [Gammaproteobacteria bacterium]
MTDSVLGDIHFYEPREGHGLPHDPFNAIVGPRPIGWISTRDASGRLNLAPYSFFNGFNYTPPIIGFASAGYKDTVRNIQETGEFVWNLATRPLAEAMNTTSAMAPPEVDEFVLSGLTPMASRLVGVPRVAESPVAFECRLTQSFQLRDASGAAIDTWLTLGEVVAVHILQSLLVDGIYDTAAAQPILRGGGPADYFEIHAEQRFRMRRPKWDDGAAGGAGAIVPG